MRKPALLLAALVLVAAARPASQAPPRAADHVLVVMLDGARPDILQEVAAPNLRALERSGAVFVKATTIFPSQTRVAFVTIPTGAYPRSHGIVGGNDFKDASWQTVSLGDAAAPEKAQSLNMRPTVFEELTALGLTSLYAGMKGYELVGARGATWTINGSRLFDPRGWASRYEPDVDGNQPLALWYKLGFSRRLLDEVLALVREHRPHFAIMNLGSADYAAHAYGPHSRQYREALEYLDGLVGELLKALDELGIRQRTTLVVSADHGFTQVNPSIVIAPFANPKLQALTDRGIEHHVTDTGGTSMGVYIRDKSRLKEVVGLLKAQPWFSAISCEDRTAGCDRTLREQNAYFPGRSPDLLVELDDDASLGRARSGAHGSAKSIDMRIPLFFSGAGVTQGVYGSAELVDIAPTALRLLGVPQKFLRPDGRVLEEILRE